MRATRHLPPRRCRVLRAVGEQLGGEGSCDGRLACPRRPVEEVCVRGLALRRQRGHKHRSRVRVCLDAWQEVATGGGVVHRAILEAARMAALAALGL